MKARFIKKSDRLVVIGTSAGGIHALKIILEGINRDFNIPVVIVIHRLKNVKSHMESVLQASTSVPIKEAEEKEKIQRGNIYIAPANYHLLIEEDGSFSLSVDELVNFSRPSIDITLVSASEVYKEKAIGIILTGANADGAYGLQSIHENGGVTVVQLPEEAQVNTMPLEALKAVPGAQKLSLRAISQFLNEL